MLSWQYPWLHFRCFAPEGDTGGGGGDGGGGGTGGAGGDAGDAGDGGGDAGGTPAPTYDTWYAALEAGPKALMDTHIAGLRSALTSEKDQRKTLANQLRDATGKLDKGSDARKALEDMTSKLEVAEKRAQFYEDAGKPEMGCSDVGLAYLAALGDALFDARGNVDWDELKRKHPVLFAKPKLAPANAGAGVGQTGGVKGTGMNAFIRAAAGRVT
ncbi:MAG TPA: hypothetical protein VM537_16265 [Anaerolineae bacterium]|nr:hypothetical protein [Anaerolineae bacterium]